MNRIFQIFVYFHFCRDEENCFRPDTFLENDSFVQFLHDLEYLLLHDAAKLEILFTSCQVIFCFRRTTIARLCHQAVFIPKNSGLPQRLNLCWFSIDKSACLKNSCRKEHSILPCHLISQWHLTMVLIPQVNAASMKRNPC